MEYKNYYSNTPLRQAKFLSLNENKKDKNISKNISKNNNNYDISPILNKKKNYKFSRTPTLPKKSNNRKPLLKSNLNYESNKNNFYFNDDNLDIQMIIFMNQKCFLLITVTITQI